MKPSDLIISADCIGRANGLRPCYIAILFALFDLAEDATATTPEICSRVRRDLTAVGYNLRQLRNWGLVSGTPASRCRRIPRRWALQIPGRNLVYQILNPPAQ